MTPVCKTQINGKTQRIGLRPTLVALALGLTFVAGSANAQVGPNPNTLNRLMHAKPAKEIVRLSPVREAALEASARALGTQTGLIEHAKEIAKEIESRRVVMEKTFRFGDLVIGQGVLPPVLLHTENAATVTDDTMRLAGAVYEIKHPARFFSGAPSWRDWLLMGLPTEADMPEMPTNEQLLPRDANERAYWQQKIEEAYISGRRQAREIFDHNLSMLEQVYGGMRTFYDLYQRNMVSAPIIAKSQEIVTQTDANTIVVGDTLFRITMPSQFQTNPEAWRALEAKPTTKPLLPIGMGFDPEQVRHAYGVYQQQMLERQRQLEAERGIFGKNPVAPVKAQAKPRVETPKPAPAAQTMAIPREHPVRVQYIQIESSPTPPAAAPARAVKPQQPKDREAAPAPKPAAPVAQPLPINAATPLFSIPSR